MVIKGFLKGSLLEWEGRLSSVLFLPGCNLRCHYCHAADLVLHPDELDTVPVDDVLSHLRRSKGWVEAVAITGGEPTLHGQELLELVQRLKDASVEVMVETNGTHPEWVERLLEGGLVDAMSMDVKAPLAPEEYQRVTDTEVDIDALRRSIHLIKQGQLSFYEFRTTLVPGLVGLDELERLLPELEGCRQIALQNFQPDHCLDPELHDVMPFTSEELDEMERLASQFTRRCVVRGRDHAATATADAE